MRKPFSRAAALFVVVFRISNFKFRILRYFLPHDPFDRIRILAQNSLGELGHGLSQQRVNPLARHVGRRDKRKGSFMKARMGKHQLGALENGTSNQQQIHVEWPWTPTLFRPPVSSSGDLHLLGGPQQFPNSAAAIKHQRGIQIIRLGWAYGPRLVET